MLPSYHAFMLPSYYAFIQPCFLKLAHSQPLVWWGFQILDLGGDFDRWKWEATPSFITARIKGSSTKLHNTTSPPAARRK